MKGDELVRVREAALLHWFLRGLPAGAIAREDYRRVVRLDNKTYVVEQARAALERLDRIES